eukprot:UC1_evm1s643
MKREAEMLKEEEEKERKQSAHAEIGKPKVVTKTAEVEKVQVDVSVLPEPRGVNEKASTKLRLLAVDAPLRIPLLQEPGPITEDMLEREQNAMTQMGDSKTAAEERSRMQSASLASDMAAFKAANPGCTLPDFVRWHSPRDWIMPDKPAASSGAAATTTVAAHADATDATTTIGHLSERMAAPGNLWQELWTAAVAEPALTQDQLFDPTTAAEEILTELEALPHTELMWQLLPALLRSSHARLVTEAVSGAEAVAGGSGRGSDISSSGGGGSSRGSSRGSGGNSTDTGSIGKVKSELEALRH